LAAVASLLGTRELQALAKQIEQRDARVGEVDVPPYAVDGKADGEVHAGLRTMR
jgi:hypothetical protein